VTTDQILIGVGLILALAAGSQVLASRLRIPAIIVLLPAGFVSPWPIGEALTFRRVARSSKHSYS
jgi:NhaP-type Na+/H+ or K+/H+ antiporter